MGDVIEQRPVGAGGPGEPSQELHDALGEVLTGLADAASLAEASSHLSVFGVRHLGADAAGLVRQGRRAGLQLLAATDPVVSRLESARAAGALASRTTPLVPGEVLLLRGLGADPGAPAWHAVAARLGFRSALVLGLPALSGGAAALALYAHGADAFATHPLPAATWVVGLAGWALHEVERRLNLEEALRTRGIIGQAQGVLMERYGLTSDRAMAFLRRQSQDTQLPIRDLATEVVRQREAESHAAEVDLPDR
ncbi:ANTAR domain-containing protein [Nocardioides pyridinolyticus]